MPPVDGDRLSSHGHPLLSHFFFFFNFFSQSAKVDHGFRLVRVATDGMPWLTLSPSSDLF